MDFTVLCSNNSEFKHDGELEKDFDFEIECLDDDFVIYFPSYRKYKQNITGKEVFSCREQFMEFLQSMKDITTDIFIKIQFRDKINHLLVSYLVRNCYMSEKVFFSFEAKPHYFKFKGKDLSITNTHFISFLILMCDPEFYKVRSRTKISGVWKDKNREEIAEKISSIISKDASKTDSSYYEGDIDFTISDCIALLGYIKFIVEKNKMIRGNNYCSGPEDAFNYK